MKTTPAVPYLASCRWYGVYAGALYAGAPEEEAVRAANAACGLTARAMTRSEVWRAGVTRAEEDTQGILLSVPAEGGASALKRLAPGEVRVSLHGDWPHRHRGALSAAYGRTPWFIHFYPSFLPLLSEPHIRPGMPLGDLTEPLHRQTLKALGLDAAIASIREASPEALARLRETGKLEAAKMRPAEAFLGMLMRRGRDSVLGLLAGVMCLLALITVSAAPAAAAEPEAPRLETKVYTGYYYFVDEYGDTVRMTLIRDVYVYPPLKFKNKKQEEFYWRTVRDVRKTLPYAKLAFSTLCETYEYIQTIPDKKKREAHLKRLEHDIFEQYKPVMKNMTKSQGKVLLKLINRETDQSSYSIVKAFLGSFRAGFWQTFGRFFGMNMKAGFDPAKNKEDATIDRIATLIEQGTL